MKSEYKNREVVANVLRAFVILETQNFKMNILEWKSY